MGKQVPEGSVVAYSRGLRKGFYVTKRTPRAKPGRRRNGSSRTRLINKIIKSIAGYTPYEKRAIEFYKLDDPKMDKRAGRFLKKRLGSWKRAHYKRDELKDMLRGD